MEPLWRTVTGIDTYTPVFPAALFTIVRTQKPLNVHRQKRTKIWHIYAMEFYSAITKNETMPFAATWVDLEVVILSEVSQTQKDQYNKLSLKCGN